MTETTKPDENPPTAASGTGAGDASESVKLSTKKVLAVINDGEDDPDTVAALQAALYRFGAQDASMELPLSWQRVQRRLGGDTPTDGFATSEQVAAFADRAGITLVK